MQVYPWALLVFWQLLMPGVSFWGHLGGLMAGEAYVRGWLKALMPSQSLFQVTFSFETVDIDLTALHTSCWRDGRGYHGQSIHVYGWPSHREAQSL